MKQKRTDIQVLRGIAVLLVVLYHAQLTPISGGYLGVDIFYVISGFLITGIIQRALDTGTFSFKAFYLRRARRLLPAAYTTLIGTSALAYMFLTKSQWKDYLYQLLGSVTFTANIAMLFQSGYFDDSAAGKLLLHMWSLSLEEQFYLFAPFVLFLCPKRWRGMLLGMSLSISFGLCLYAVARQVNMAFYLLPTRVWELLAGSLASWAMLRRPNLSIHRGLKYIAFIVVLIVCLKPLDVLHPRLDALVVVIGTTILLLGHDDWVPKSLATRALVYIGDVSYSLYLVHWPLFAFANLGYLGQVPVEVRAGLVGISFSLAILQYHYVEEVFRHGWRAGPARTTLGLVATTALVVVIPLPALVSLIGDSNGRNQLPALVSFGSDGRNQVDLATVMRPNFGLSPKCEQRGAVIVDDAECRTSQSPQIAIWGDSLAMHLVPGMHTLDTASQGIIQITKSSCGPTLGLAFTSNKYTPQWAKKCVAFNYSALEKIKSTPSIKYVILASTFVQYFKDLGQEFFLAGKIVPRDDEIGQAALILTIEELRAAGKVPIIVAPPPHDGTDVGACNERKMTGLIVLGKKTCDIAEADSKAHFAKVEAALKNVQTETGVKIYWPQEVLCSQGRCITRLDDVLIYRDTTHFTHEGSALVVKRLNLMANLR